MSEKKERYRRDTDWGFDGFQRLERLAKGERRSGAEIARDALVDYEVRRSFFRDTVRGTTLKLFQTLVEQENGLYGDPAFEEPSPADEAMSSLGSLLNSIYAAQGIREAFERVLDRNRMTRLEVPTALSEDVSSYEDEDQHQNIGESGA